MTRTTPEWTGKTDDTPVPMRVKMRVLERQDGRCAKSQHKFRPGDKKELDHIIALANGGTNSEGNLQWILATEHKKKTRQDVAQKKKDRRVAAKHNSMTPKKPKQMMNGRPIKRKVSGQVVYADTGEPV